MDDSTKFYWAPTAAQFLGEPVQGGPSGAVYCRRKWSHVALLKCWQLQADEHCFCGSAVSREEADRIAAAMGDSELDDRDESLVNKTEVVDFMARAAGLQDALKEFEAGVDRLRSVGYRDLPTIETAVDSLRDDTMAAQRFLAMFGNSDNKTKTTAKSPDVQKKVGVRTLRRRAEFEGISTTQAVKQILESAAEPVRRNELAERIFEISANGDLKKALASLGSQLSAGVKKKLWRSAGDGRYAGISADDS